MISEMAMRWLYPRADAVVAVSKGVAQDLLNLMPQLKPKLTVIYNPVIDAAFYAKADAPVEHPWFQPNQPPVILGVGRHHFQKGFDTLLRAFARVRQQMPSHASSFSAKVPNARTWSGLRQSWASLPMWICPALIRTHFGI
jgi:glycosyltransferase involved in cell wall biosynthesis